MSEIIVIAIFALLGIAVILVVINRFGRDDSSRTTAMSKRQMMDAIRRMAAQSDRKGFYWKGYRNRKPQQAKDIEALLNLDLSMLGDVDAFEIVTSVERWSKNAGVPISQLKVYFMNEVKPIINEIGLEVIIERMKKEIDKEAKSFCISCNHTISAFMHKWLIEMKQKNQIL